MRVATYGMLSLVFVFGCGGTEPQTKPSKSLTPKPTTAPSAREAAKEVPADPLEIPPPPPGVHSNSTAQPTKPEAGATAPKLPLLDLDLAGLEKRISKRDGKYLVIDTWATWCVPCVEKFPKFVALSGSGKSSKAQFVTLVVEEEDADKVRAFLEKHPGNLEHWRLTSNLQELQEKYDFEGVPRYLVFDPAGKLAVNVDKFEELDQRLAALLK